MTLKEFASLLGTTGYLVAFSQFPAEEPHEPPFICYITIGEEPFSADGVVYYAETKLQVELYTPNKDLAAETAVEGVLSPFFYVKDEGYIESEKMYMVTYQLAMETRTGGLPSGTQPSGGLDIDEFYLIAKI